jgi:hypothetical protein
MKAVSVQDHVVKSCALHVVHSPMHGECASKGGECEKSLMTLYRNVSREKKALQQHCSTRRGSITRRDAI